LQKIALDRRSLSVGEAGEAAALKRCLDAKT